MTTKNETECWACHRVIVGEPTMGLCPNCINKYGSPAAAAAVLGIGIGGKLLWKNKGKIIKTVAEAAKIFKG